MIKTVNKSSSFSLTSSLRLAAGFAVLLATAASAFEKDKPATPSITPETAASSAGRFIDAHVHFHACKTGELEKAIVWMTSNNVQRIINYPLAQSRPKNDAERKQMLENYAKHNGRIGRGCVIFPEEVNSVDEAVAILTREKQEGAVVFGEHYGENLKFDDPKNLRMYEACGKVGLPIMFHYNDKIRNMDEKGMPRLENVLKLYPSCTIIAHGDWWRSLPEGSCGRLLQTYPNFYADISCTVGRAGIRRDMERSREFFIKHADKLLFGTDSGWWSLGKSSAPEFALMDELKLPKDVEEKICRKNAERLFWGGKAENGKVTAVQGNTPVIDIARETKIIAGWSLQVSRKLLADEPKLTAKAFELLERQLQEIVSKVPPAAVAELQKVSLYFSPEYPGIMPRAEFHPDAGWLRNHGRDPAMAKGVEFTNVRIFEREINRMPNFALHELAHAYHNRVLPEGSKNGQIKAAYEKAKASGGYDCVELCRGNGQTNTFKRAYAMTNPQEYFAETSEAFFSRNDFFPFTKDELKKHDPEMFALLETLWVGPTKK